MFQPPPPPVVSGIDYLRLVGTAHDAQLGERVNYHALAGAPPGDVVTEPAEPAESGEDRATTIQSTKDTR